MATIQNCRLSLSETQSIPSDTKTKITFDTVVFDEGSWADTVNNKITPNQEGYYLVYAQFHSSVSATNKYLRLYTMKNAGDATIRAWYPGNTAERSLRSNDLVYFNGSTDYMDFWIRNSSTIAKDLNADASKTNVHIIGPFTSTDGFDMARITMASSQEIGTSSWTLADFDTAEFDTNSLFSSGNHRITPTKAGWYSVNFSARQEISGGAIGYASIYLNGTAVSYYGFYAFTSSVIQSWDTDKWIYCNGTTDYLDFRVYQNSGIDKTLANATSDTYACLLGPFQPTSNFRIAEVEVDGDQSVANTGEIVEFDSEISDESNNWNSSSYRFIADLNGYYKVSASIKIESKSTYEGELKIRKDGSDSCEAKWTATANSSVHCLAANDLIFLNVGEYIDIFSDHNYSSALRVYDDTFRTYIQVIGPIENIVDSEETPDEEFILIPISSINCQGAF